MWQLKASGHKSQHIPRSALSVSTPHISCRTSTWRRWTPKNAWCARKTAMASHASCARQYLTAAMNARRPTCTSHPTWPLLQARHTNFACSMSHRESCRFRERTLQLQRTCVACDIEFDEDSKTTINARPAEICTLCFGAKYCSVECKDANAYATSFVSNSSVIT